MADVTVTSDYDNSLFRNASGSKVWASVSVGYWFYISSNDATELVYRKTTNGGGDWADPVVLIAAASDILTFAVWPDWDTPGDSGSEIHVAAILSGSAVACRYRALDTGGDSAGTEVTFFTTGATGSNTTAKLALTVTRGGNIDLGGWDRQSGGTPVPFFVRSTDGGGSFSGRDATPIAPAVGDALQLAPGAETDSNDLLLFYLDDSANAIVIFTHDDSGNSWSAGTSMATISTTTLYPFHVSVAARHSDNHTIVAFNNNVGNAANDLELWDVTDEATASQLAVLVENDSRLDEGVGVCVDQRNDDLLVAYGINPAGANDGFIVFRKYDGAVGDETALSAALTYDPDFNLIAPRSIRSSGGRFAAIWTDGNTFDAYCNTRLEKTQSQALPQVFAVA